MTWKILERQNLTHQRFLTEKLMEGLKLQTLIFAESFLRKKIAKTKIKNYYILQGQKTYLNLYLFIILSSPKYIRIKFLH